MDEHAMTKGVIPVRHSSLSGLIKLPRRFEKAYLPDLDSSKERPKVNVCCEAPLPGRQAASNRLDELMTATMWIKQELILLRQHDILLKRQFFNIHHSIQSLQSTASHPPASSPLSTSANSAEYVTSCDVHNRFQETRSTTTTTTPLMLNPDSPPYYANVLMETLLVRPSLSFKLLATVDDSSDDSDDGDDVFFERGRYRPRTTSMRTSRDLAAVARRRGSKDLI